MNIVIVDDDLNYLKVLSETVTKICEKENIPINVTVTNEPLSLIEDEIYKHSDVILLDIDMPEVTGIEIASKINLLKGKSDKPFIIFVTNIEGFVFEALREHPYSFVRKSVIEDIVPCIVKIHQKLTEEICVIKEGRNLIRLLIKDIVYLEKINNYVHFHTEVGTYRERTNIESKLSDLSSYGFLRPQIGYLVNVRYIDEILKSSILLSTGEEIPLSKKYRKLIRQDFYEWMVNKR